MSKTIKNLTFTVTEEDYKKELAEGLTEDEIMKPGIYKVRRSPWANKLKKTKRVKVSIYLEDDILQYFRQRAEQPNAAPYQTQINNELRKIMESEKIEQTSFTKNILDDIEFLKALKEKLETV